MKLEKSPSPKYNKTVLDLQIKLNLIRDIIHGNWPRLQTDGFFGKQTELAVKGFQTYRNIQVNGIVTDKTMEYINDACKTKFQTFKTPKYTGPKTYLYLCFILDPIMDLISTINTLIQDQINDLIKSYSTKQLPSNIFRKALTKLDPMMNKIRTLLNKYTESQSIITKNDKIARKPTYNTRSVIEEYNIRKSNKIVSFNQTKAKVSYKNYTELSNKYIKELKKFNIADRIKRIFNQYGITGEIKIGKLKSIKITRGGIMLVYNLKDIIIDLLKIDQWGEEQWKEKFVKDCYEYLDNLIIGLFSIIITTAIIAMSAAIINITISSGALIILTAVISTIIGIFIEWVIQLLAGKDFSFSQFAMENSMDILIKSSYDD